MSSHPSLPTWPRPRPGCVSQEYPTPSEQAARQRLPKARYTGAQLQSCHNPKKCNDTLPYSMPHSCQNDEDAEDILCEHSCHTLYMGEMSLLTAPSSSSICRGLIQVKALFHGTQYDDRHIFTYSLRSWQLTKPHSLRESSLMLLARIAVSISLMHARLCRDGPAPEPRARSPLSDDVTLHRGQRLLWSFLPPLDTAPGLAWPLTRHLLMP